MGCIAFSSQKKVIKCTNSNNDQVVNQNQIKQLEYPSSIQYIDNNLKLEDPYDQLNKVSQDLSKVIVLKPLMSESPDVSSFNYNNIEVHIKPKKTKSDTSLNVHTKADTVIQRKKRTNKLSSTGYGGHNKINSSMLLLKELAFEPQNKDLPSLNKTAPCQIITLEYEAKLYEEMIDIWIEKDTEVLFKLKGLWGISQLGLCTFDGYSNKTYNGFPLCSLLARIGSQNNYIQIKNNLKYISSISGPLFLVLNIDTDLLIRNKYTLSGSISIEIHNSKKYTYIQILKMLSFDEELLELFINDSYTKHLYSHSELSVLLVINQVRTRPDLCLTYYFPTNDQVTNLIKSKRKDCNIIKFDETLKKIAEEAIDNTSLTERASKFTIKQSYSSIKEYQIKSHSKHPSVLIYEAIKIEDTFIFNDTIEYIGLSIQQMTQNEGELINYLCVFVVAGKSNSG